MGQHWGLIPGILLSAARAVALCSFPAPGQRTHLLLFQRRMPKRIGHSQGPPSKRISTGNGQFGISFVAPSVVIHFPAEMVVPSFSKARTLIAAIHKELKTTLFPTLRLKYGSPKPGSACTSRSFLKSQQGSTLDLRYVWEPGPCLLKLAGDFQVYSVL